MGGGLTDAERRWLTDKHYCHPSTERVYRYHLRKKLLRIVKDTTLLVENIPRIETHGVDSSIVEVSAMSDLRFELERALNSARARRRRQ